MKIRIVASDGKGASKILSFRKSKKIGRKIIRTEMERAAFLGYIEIYYKGLYFKRIDIN